MNRYVTNITTESHFCEIAKVKTEAIECPGDSLWQKLSKTKERLYYVENSNVELKAQLSLLNNEKLTKKKNDDEFQEFYEQLKKKDIQIFELNNVIMEKERRIINLQELCHDQDQVAKSRKIAIEIVNNRLKELDNRQVRDVSTEIDFSFFFNLKKKKSLSRNVIENVGFVEHKRNELPGRAMPHFCTTGKNGSPLPNDPSEESSGDDDSWSENLKNAYADITFKKMTKYSGGRKRVTFAGPRGASDNKPEKLRSSSAERLPSTFNNFSNKEKDLDFVYSHANKADLNEIIIENNFFRKFFLEFERNTLKNKVKAGKSMPANDDSDLKLEKSRIQLLKARSVAQSKIRELEANISNIKMQSTLEVSILTATNETLNTSREWLLNENGALQKKNEVLKTKVDDLIGELDVSLSTNALFRNRLDECEKQFEAVSQELKNVNNALHCATESKQVLLSEVDQLRDAVHAQDEFISMLEGDLIVYEAHVGILKDSLGATKSEDRQVIKSKAFAAKLNALEMEKQKIVKKSNDDRLRTKALTVKIRCLEKERYVLLQKLHKYDEDNDFKDFKHKLNQQEHQHCFSEPSPNSFNNLDKLSNQLEECYLDDHNKLQSNLSNKIKLPVFPLLVHPTPLSALQTLPSSYFKNQKYCNQSKIEINLMVGNEISLNNKRSLPFTSSPFVPISPVPSQRVYDQNYKDNCSHEKLSPSFQNVKNEENMYLTVSKSSSVNKLLPLNDFIPSNDIKLFDQNIQTKAVEVHKNIENNKEIMERLIKKAEEKFVLQLEALRNNCSELEAQLFSKIAEFRELNHKIDCVLIDSSDIGSSIEICFNFTNEELTNIEKLSHILLMLKNKLTGLTGEIAQYKMNSELVVDKLEAAKHKSKVLKSENYQLISLSNQYELEKLTLQNTCAEGKAEINDYKQKLSEKQNLLEKVNLQLDNANKIITEKDNQCALLSNENQRLNFVLEKMNKQLIEMKLDKENSEQKLCVVQDDNFYLTATLAREKERLERLVDLLRNEVDRFRVEAELSRNCLEDLRQNSTSGAEQKNLCQRPVLDQNQVILQHKTIKHFNNEQKILLLFPVYTNQPNLNKLKRKIQLFSSKPFLQGKKSLKGQVIYTLFLSNKLMALSNDECDFQQQYIQPTNNAYVQLFVPNGFVNVTKSLGNEPSLFTSSSLKTKSGVNTLPQLVKTANFNNFSSTESEMLIKNCNLSASIVLHSSSNNNTFFNVHAASYFPNTANSSSVILNNFTADYVNLATTKNCRVSTDRTCYGQNVISSSIDVKIDAKFAVSNLQVEEKLSYFQSANETFCACEQKSTGQLLPNNCETSDQNFVGIENCLPIKAFKEKKKTDEEFEQHLTSNINQLLILNNELEIAVDVLKSEIWSLNNQLHKFQQLVEHEEIVVQLNNYKELLSNSDKKLRLKNATIESLHVKLSVANTEFENIISDKKKIEHESQILKLRYTELQQLFDLNESTFKKFKESIQANNALKKENCLVSEQLNYKDLRKELDAKSEKLIQIQSEKLKMEEEYLTNAKQLQCLKKTNVEKSDKHTEVDHFVEDKSVTNEGIKQDRCQKCHTNTTILNKFPSSSSVSETVSMSLVAGINSVGQKLRSISSSAVHPVNLQLAILAARLEAKSCDNDSLFRTNVELTFNNVQLQTTIDELKRKIQILVNNHNICMDTKEFDHNSIQDFIISDDIVAKTFDKNSLLKGKELKGQLKTINHATSIVEITLKNSTNYFNVNFTFLLKSYESVSSLVKLIKFYKLKKQSKSTRKSKTSLDKLQNISDVNQVGKKKLLKESTFFDDKNAVDGFTANVCKNSSGSFNQIIEPVESQIEKTDSNGWDWEDSSWTDDDKLNDANINLTNVNVVEANLDYCNKKTNIYSKCLIDDDLSIVKKHVKKTICDPFINQGSNCQELYKRPARTKDGDENQICDKGMKENDKDSWDW